VALVAWANADTTGWRHWLAPPPISDDLQQVDGGEVT
jgi:hypothetical protein